MTLIPSQRCCRALPQTLGNRRAGLSVLEFIGCVVAVVGGLWLGALYLGVDVRKTVYDTMDRTNVLDKVPPRWRPDDPHGTASREQTVAALREELGMLRSEIAGLSSDTPPATDALQQSHADHPAAANGDQRSTLAYWNQLNEIVLGEASLQQEADAAITDSRAARAFVLKSRVSQFASEAVATVPTNGVDPELLQFGQQLTDWYEQGNTLYKRAAQIWQLPTASQRTNLTERWKPTQLQHRNEAKLLNKKAAALRSALTRRYGVEFPGFGSPAATQHTEESSSSPAS